jgi:hypothetical protein
LPASWKVDNDTNNADRHRFVSTLYTFIGLFLAPRGSYLPSVAMAGSEVNSCLCRACSIGSRYMIDQAMIAIFHELWLASRWCRRFFLISLRRSSHQASVYKINLTLWIVHEG